MPMWTCQRRRTRRASGRAGRSGLLALALLALPATALAASVTSLHDAEAAPGAGLARASGETAVLAATPVGSGGALVPRADFAGSVLTGPCGRAAADDQAPATCDWIQREAPRLFGRLGQATEAAACDPQTLRSTLLEPGTRLGTPSECLRGRLPGFRW